MAPLVDALMIGSADDLLLVSVPILGSLLVLVAGWLLNGRSERQEDAYRRRERRYRYLLEGFRGFYAGSTDQAEATRLKQRFIDEMTLAWLYCPDDAIRAGYDFLRSTHVDANAPRGVPDAAGQRFVAALRRDLVGQTTLQPNDFMIVGVNSTRATGPN